MIVIDFKSGRESMPTSRGSRESIEWFLDSQSYNKPFQFEQLTLLNFDGSPTVSSINIKSIILGSCKHIVLSVHQDARIIVLALALLLATPTKDYQVALELFNLFSTVS